ncbi:efflux RND transporter permease subunit [Aeoliella sp. ICT_H6.2]|uniref:Efflux RND transporter permease subunit n=1 Tax=Aeoliella straminimaris TaxID=2954799 RepID=A0A9X2JHD9_9BACT|nr:efflux RND transporter permease subunit [Aeoliella straminimaris]MCO6044533.1 efflux RND transporter permease subunit [Aeoliella straminimaris]
MQLVDAFVRNPVKVTVGVLLVALFGMVALLRMPMQLTPEVETPTITIETRWPGASPQEVEQEIIVEQEEQLKGVEGARKLSSESSDSVGRITIEFAVGTDMDQAILKVNSRLQQVREYPEEADQPVLTTSDAAARAIAWFIFSALPPSEDEIDQFVADHPELSDDFQRIQAGGSVGLKMLRLRNLAAEHPEVAQLLPPPELEVPKLRRFAEDEIEARFERVAGVSQSNVIGGLEDEMQVIVNLEHLAARQLTLTEVRDVLKSQNRDTSAGNLDDGKRRYVFRALNQFRTPEQVENQLLAVRDGRPVYVRDVAEVQLGYKKAEGLVRRFGESSIAINCERAGGANVIDVMEGLRTACAELNRDILNPRGLMLTQVYDETDYINSSVDLVQQNILLGSALTMIVLMLFLHMGVRTLLTIPLILVTALASIYVSPWIFAICLAIIIGAGAVFARGALVVALAIPVSIIGTFLVLGMLGRSLNVISLAGLAFAVGMLVDNAVVVLENIYRRYSMGEEPFTAAVRGTQEVWGAVVSSTLTTIAVFLPVVFMEEEAGQLFRDIALAITAAVALSLVVSVTLIPTAAARLFHRRKVDDLPELGTPDPPQTTSRVARMMTRFGERFSGMIVGINNVIQKSVSLQIATVCLLVGLAVGVSYLLWPRVEYLPNGNRNLVIGIVIPPPGYNIAKLMSLGETVEDKMRPYWDIDEDTDLSQLDGPAIEDFFFVVRGRQVFMGVRAKDPLRSAELVPVIQKSIGGLPGTFAIAKQTSLFERGLTAGRTVDVEIVGPDIEKLVGLGKQTFGKVMGSPGDDETPPQPPLIADAQAQPVPSLDLSSPEVHVEPKLIHAAEMQMSATDIGFGVDTIIDGAYVSDYFLGGKKIDLTVMADKSFNKSTGTLASAPIAVPSGQLVPLDALADVRISSGPEQINHRERERAITIQVTPPPEVALEDAMSLIDSEIVQPMRESGQLEGGYRITLAGTADKLSQAWQALRFNVLLALIITYLLMAALFESWIYPLVIILSVPLGAAGGVIGLAILNRFVLQPLDVLTMLGFVVLIGTVVNNPILIVHQSLNHLRFDGMSPREAILESVRTRIRPIFMTTTTTVLGLAPLVMFPGAGSELYRGLGSVVLGGLVVSTLFTLVFVPTLLRLALEVFGGTKIPREHHAWEQAASDDTILEPAPATVGIS